MNGRIDFDSAEGQGSTFYFELPIALATVKGLEIRDVKIEITSGALVMSGMVSHASLAIQARDAVKRIPGLKSIQNHLASGDQMGWD